jgi:hypothetical protein
MSDFLSSGSIDLGAGSSPAQPIDCQPVNVQSVDCQSVDYQLINSQLVDSQTTNAQVIAPQSANSQAIPAQPMEPQTFRISILIRGTLMLLYVALMVPLPVLARTTAAPIAPEWLTIALVLGGIFLVAALGEQVQVDDQRIRVTYPVWARWAIRRGWSLDWQDIQALKPRSTGQGGLVYYFVGRDGAGYLLPMRMMRFGKFVAIVQAKTGIDTRDVRALAQPWMYWFLLGFTLLLLAIDAWVLIVAGQGGVALP